MLYNMIVMILKDKTNNIVSFLKQIDMYYLI